MKIKNYVLSIFIFSFSLVSYSQDENENLEMKNAFAASFGLPGLGIEYARKLSPKLSTRLAWHSAQLINLRAENIEIKDDNVDLLANAEVSIIDLGIEYNPFKNSSFKLTTGIGFLTNVNTNLVVTYTEDVKVGDVIITKNDVGEIVADVTWSGIAPYVGIGFGRAIPKSRFGFGFELGTYYTSSPDVKLTASELLAPTASQEENLQESLSTFKFIPRLQIRLAYKF
ncbi:MAG: hypothetical protein COW43_06740 [Flavobacteriaceae bacterium CG17_big_fil_post_rev_8_21_14_2_50_31_13]|nr:MAG: hypothetical protein COW43_06740 [Flavobacteriaceae bacterium CG17_big_fil_post_rev_8_21_14_2_50_31_13]